MCFNLFALLFCNSMSCSGCSALHGVDPNLEPLDIREPLEWVNWDHEGFAFPPFLHVLSSIMDGIKAQNFSLMSSTVTK